MAAILSQNKGKSVETFWLIVRYCLYAAILIYLVNGFRDDPSVLILWQSVITVPLAVFFTYQYMLWKQSKESVASVQELINLADQDAERLQAHLEMTLRDLRDKIAKKDVQMEIDPPAADTLPPAFRQRVRLGEEAFYQISDIAKQLTAGRKAYLAAIDAEKKSKAKKMSDASLKRWKDVMETYDGLEGKVEELRRILDRQHRRLR